MQDKIFRVVVPEEEETEEEPEKLGFFARIVKFFKNLFEKIGQWFKNLLGSK